MNDFFRSKKFIILLCAILLSLIMAIVASLTGGVSPISNTVNWMMRPFERVYDAAAGKLDQLFGYIYDYDKIAEENEQLRDRVAELEDELSQVDKYILENRELRALIGVDQAHNDYDVEIAEVIERTFDSYSYTFTIDKGSNSGIEVNDCVITRDGMAGFVTEVGTIWAKVTSVVDVDMSAGAIDARTREIGVAQGQYEYMKKEQLKLAFLDKESKVLVGDVIQTSGVGGLFPKGISIGKVVEVGVEEHDLSGYAVIEPMVDLDEMITVMVIKSFEVVG